jgi:hypothetical protein
MTAINLPPSAGLSGWLRLSGAGTYELVPELPLSDYPTIAVDAGRMLSICTGCGSTATCTDVLAATAGDRMTVSVSDGTTLHLQNLDTRADNHVHAAAITFRPAAGGSTP